MHGGAVDPNPESQDEGSGFPSTPPPPPPPNARSSAASFPKVVLSPEQELQLLVEHCRAVGGLVAAFEIVRKRSKSAVDGLQSTNLRVGRLEDIIGQEPTHLKQGSGALQMLAEIKVSLDDIQSTLKADREARQRAVTEQQRAEIAAKEAAERSPATKIKWIAISAFVGAVVVSVVAGTTAYVTMHWNANPPPPPAPITAPAH